LICSDPTFFISSDFPDSDEFGSHQLPSANKSRLELDPWEVNTERSYYEEQVLSPDKNTEHPANPL
jgi:hypothetical protein